MITITDLEKSHGARTLFRDVSLQLVAEGKYGVVGANGSGKSSLLRIIAGEEEASNGSITIPRKARVGVLGQDHFRYEETPILDVVMMGDGDSGDMMPLMMMMMMQPGGAGGNDMMMPMMMMMMNKDKKDDEKKEED